MKERTDAKRSMTDCTSSGDTAGRGCGDGGYKLMAGDAESRYITARTTREPKKEDVEVYNVEETRGREATSFALLGARL